MLGLLVLELFAMYATGRQTDGQTNVQTGGQKQRLLPLPYCRRHNDLHHLLGQGSFSIVKETAQNIRNCLPLCLKGLLYRKGYEKVAILI